MVWSTARLSLALAVPLVAQQVGSTIAQGAERVLEGQEFFERKIRPLLIERCYECHSAEAKKLKGGLRLDLPDGILKGGDSGPAIVRGDPDKSLLIQAVRYLDQDLQMPPRHKLSSEQIADLEAWVRMGAPDSRTASDTARPGDGIDVAKGRKFWSFQPVKSPPLPQVHHRAWLRGPIDAFILSK